jgi:hypothetical protein
VLLPAHSPCLAERVEGQERRRIRGIEYCLGRNHSCSWAVLEPGLGLGLDRGYRQMYIEGLVGVVYCRDMGEGDHSAESLLLDDQVVLDQGCSIGSTSYSSPSCNVLRFLISPNRYLPWSSKFNWTISSLTIRPRRFLAKISLDLASKLIEGISLPLSLRRYQSLIKSHAGKWADQSGRKCRDCSIVTCQVSEAYRMIVDYLFEGCAM